MYSSYARVFNTQVLILLTELYTGARDIKLRYLRVTVALKVSLLLLIHY